MPYVQTQNIQFSSQCCILFAENATLLISETCYIHFPKFAGVKLLITSNNTTYYFKFSFY